jgi:hypothetical protein
LEDAERKTHVYDISLNKLKIKGKQDLWINTEDIEEPGQQTTPEGSTEHKQKTDEVAGLEKGISQKDNPRIILEQHRGWDLDDDGIEEQYIITVDKESNKVLRIEELTTLNQGTDIEESFEHFTAYSFIPNPDSWMGFGFGHLMEHLNHSVNSLTNQLIDSGTLSNTISGFINRRSNMKTGDLTFKMGEFKTVDLATDDIRKAIYQNQFNTPSNVLFVLLELLQGYAQSISAVSDAMLGQIPPSDTTATTMLAVMEQGLKVFSTIHKRAHRNLKKELKKIVALNRLYLEEKIYFTVQDSTSQEMKLYESGKKDFESAIDVIPVSDPTITSRAETLIKARQAFELGMQIPDVANNANARFWLTRNLFEALEVKNIDNILQPPPPPPDLPPIEEEAQFLRDVNIAPLPHQDHATHLQSHRIFEASDAAQQLSPQGRKILEAHIKETIALLYLQQQQSAEALGG